MTDEKFAFFRQEICSYAQHFCGNKSVAEWLMASRISVYVAAGVKPARFYAGRFLDALHKEFDKYKSITFQIDDS